MSTLTPRIGVAGWSIPKNLRQVTRPNASLLEHYAARFDAVEINSSFYRPHRRATYQRWAATVPDLFRFAVKMPRTITHEAQLVDCQAELHGFLDDAGGLHEKLAVILVQLPASLSFQPKVARAFFRDLGSRTAARIVCEPRHPSWLCAAAIAVYEKYSIVRVKTDPLPPGFPCATSCDVAGFEYRRLHGSPRMYYSSYSADYLVQLQRTLHRRAHETWCIFDNTAMGAAWSNALNCRNR